MPVTTPVDPHKAEAKKADPPDWGAFVGYHHADTVQDPGTVSPALVLAVHDDQTLRLMVFGCGGAQTVYGAAEGDQPGQWQPLKTVLAELAKDAAVKAEAKKAEEAAQAKAAAEAAKAEHAKGDHGAK
jgi:hypothetical protein